MKFVASLILVLINVVNIPLKKLYKKTQKWYLPMIGKDKIIYFAFAPFYWILVALAFIFDFMSDQVSGFMS